MVRKKPPKPLPEPTPAKRVPLWDRIGGDKPPLPAESAAAKAPVERPVEPVPTPPATRPAVESALGVKLRTALKEATVRSAVPERPAGMVPTDEQRDGLLKAAEVFEKRGPRVLVLVAGAGCGKTAELRMLEEVLHGQGQYTAFNSSIVADSAAKFRKAKCNTTHSLAFRAVGARYKHRLGGRRVRSHEVAAMLGLETVEVATVDMATLEPKVKKLDPGFLAGQVTSAIKRFCQSADRTIDLHHFRKIAGIDASGEDANDKTVRGHLLPFARKAWLDLSSVSGTLPFSHDHYVKVWQLGGNGTRPYIAADYILLDEAQDTAPVMLDILKQQTHAMLILVGDDNQQIYEWRGAVNALGEFNGAPRGMLSQSFRFGQAIADVANAILRTLDCPTDLVMKGLPSIPSRVEAVSNPRCFLCRTNAGAISQLLTGLSQNKRGHLIGGGGDVADLLKAIAQLQRGSPTSHPELSCFDSWAEVEAYSKTDEGEEMALIVRLVKKFTAEKILQAIDNMPDESASDFVVATAHKSKGREWSSVKLGADFPTADRMLDSDRRLLYVAATRAQEQLDISECPPFTIRERINGDGDTVSVPVIVVKYSSPMPTAEQLVEHVAAKEEEVKAPEATVEEFTWANMDGGWLIRGPEKALGSRVTVVRKNGSTSEVVLKELVKTIGNLRFYRI